MKLRTDSVQREFKKQKIFFQSVWLILQTGWVWLMGVLPSGNKRPAGEAAVGQGI